MNVLKFQSSSSIIFPETQNPIPNNETNTEHRVDDKRKPLQASNSLLVEVPLLSPLSLIEKFQCLLLALLVNAPQVSAAIGEIQDNNQ